MWEWLERKGILLEPLYHDIWRDCGLREGAQALVDLLVHFDLAAKISQVPKEMRRYEGCKYFVPSMLKALSQQHADQETERMTGQPQESIQKAATLHIIFNTGYVPPGFFVRLAAQITKNKKCTPIFERGVYRDSITFRYGEVDRVTITESKTLVSIHVDFLRITKRTPTMSRFAESCVFFRSELYAMCKEVLCWLPSIEVDIAFKCSCPMNSREHFAIIYDRMNRDSKLFCHQDTLYQLDPEHKYWLPRAQHTLQVCTDIVFSRALPYLTLFLQLDTEDGKPVRIEVKNVATELKTRGKIKDLAREMEVEIGRASCRVRV